MSQRGRGQFHAERPERRLAFAPFFEDKLELRFALFVFRRRLNFARGKQKTKAFASTCAKRAKMHNKE